MSGAGSFCGKRRQERYASVCAIQRFGAFDRRLRAPFASGYGDLPLPKPVRNAILVSKWPGIWRMSDWMSPARVPQKSNLSVS